MKHSVPDARGLTSLGRGAARFLTSLAPASARFLTPLARPSARFLTPLARPSARFDLPRACAALLLCAVACKKSEPYQPPPPGLRDGEGKPVVAAPITPPPPPAPAPEPPTVYDFERGTADPGSLSAKAPPSGLAPGNALPAPAADAGGPPRDLSAELSAALAPATNCIDVAQAAAQPEGRLTISVSAYLQGSGRVSRATVTAPGQPPAALACMQKLVLGLSLRAPIPAAPVQVSATTQLQVRGAGATGGQATPAGSPVRPQPSNPDVAQPEPGDLAGPP